jgi:hypothetical protein
VLLQYCHETLLNEINNHEGIAKKISPDNLKTIHYICVTEETVANLMKKRDPKNPMELKEPTKTSSDRGLFAELVGTPLVKLALRYFKHHLPNLKVTLKEICVGNGDIVVEFA